MNIKPDDLKNDRLNEKAKTIRPALAFLFIRSSSFGPYQPVKAGTGLVVSIPCVPSDEMIACMTFLFERSIANWTSKAFGTCKINKTCFKQVSILQFVTQSKI